jgi:ribosomal protein S18 acetylase RimI-like enzyme
MFAPFLQRDLPLMTISNDDRQLSSDGHSLSTTPHRRVTVRAMDIEDLRFVARVHRECLPGGFFVNLGDRFLRAYHQSFVTSPASLGLIGEIDGERAGFLVGTVDHVRYNRHVGRHHRSRLAVAGGWALLGRPGLLRRLLGSRIRRYTSSLRRARQPVVSTAPAVRFGVLSHVAVDSNSRRQGVGRALVESFVGIAQLHGARRVELVTRSGGEAARSFYPALGWTPGDEYRDGDGNPWIPFTLDVT